MKDIFKKYLMNGGLACILTALLTEFFIESVSRHSVWACLEFISKKPETFLYNAGIIFITLLPVLLVKRRIFAGAVITTFWVAIGITNGVVLTNRMTPFTVKDLALAENGLSIMTNYFTSKEIIMIVGGIAIATVLFVTTFIFAPKRKKPLPIKKNICFVIVCAVLFVGFTNLAIEKKWLSTYFPNLGTAYEEYGLPYCFINTWLNKGIDQPINYGSSAVLDIFSEGVPTGISYASSQLEEIEGVGGEASHKPNVVIVQLESFIDPTLIKNVTLSQDPIPTFREIKNNYSSGFLIVPSVGAGTANTELEVLSGLRMKSFGPGEYPYKTVLQGTTCETLAYILKGQGYAAHAIHNHRGAFYDRDKVYKNLGFDTFTPLEYMNNVEKTPKNWAKDKVLTGEIMYALESTEEPDFIMAVSVQGHGKYPIDKREYDFDLAVEMGEDENEDWSNSLEYYVQQLKEMDDFILELLTEIVNYDEDTVVVFYGDHLPVLDLSAKDMANGTVYQTEYVIWSNFPMEEKNEKLFAYQLSSSILQRIGIETGIMPWYHQNWKKDENYIANLNMLQYDMLYGKHYIYDGANPFEPTDLKMGVRPIEIKELLNINGHKYVKGQNFTSFSKVAVNGEYVETAFIDPYTLRIPHTVDISDISAFSVGQLDKYDYELGAVHAQND